MKLFSDAKMQETKVSTKSSLSKGLLFSNAKRSEDSAQHVFGCCFARDLAEIPERIMEANQDDLFTHFFI